MVTPLYLIMLVMTLVMTTTAQNRRQRYPEEDGDSPEITGRGRWGEWGKWEYCPMGTHAKAAQIKFQQLEVYGDVTALNGVRLFCGDPADPMTKIITSSVGPFGEWLPLTMICPHELYAVGMKFENAKIFQDDAAGTNLRFSCLSKYPHESATGKHETVVLQQPGLDWVWGRWITMLECKSGEAICGLQTQVEGDQGTGDDTGFNDIRIKCCKLNPSKRRYMSG